MGINRLFVAQQSWLLRNSRCYCQRHLYTKSDDSKQSPILPRKADIVICGGGVIGISVAYHLSKLGLYNTVVLEKDVLCSGATHASANRISLLRWNSAESALSIYSARLYEQLQNDGYDVGWRKCGSINVARTHDRMIAYRRAIVNARETTKVQGEILKVEDIAERIPMIMSSDLMGGIYIPGDGLVNAVKLTNVLAKKAEEQGVRIIENCRVLETVTKRDKVAAVRTDAGDISCRYFVNCAGQWAWHLGQMSKGQKVRVPLHACEHSYVITRPMAGITKDLPIIRDLDGYVYMCANEVEGSVTAGGFEPVGKPVDYTYQPSSPSSSSASSSSSSSSSSSIKSSRLHHSPPNSSPSHREHPPFSPRGPSLTPSDLSSNPATAAAAKTLQGRKVVKHNEEVNADWDQFQVLLEQVLHRMPLLRDATVDRLVNAPEAFTPDGRYILGQCPELPNYFVATGMNATGISSAGGVGKVMSEWIANVDHCRIDDHPNAPSILQHNDMWSQDVRRFADLHNNRQFLKSRVKETTGAVTNCAGPDIEYKSGRGVRTSPLYTRLVSKGAQFGQIIGFEPALYFNKPSTSYVDEFTGDFNSRSPFLENISGNFGKPNYFDQVKSEYWSAREGVCLIDMSTFAKFLIESPNLEAVEYLQRICSNDVDRTLGSMTHSGIQNYQGGYENDCSVVRLAENKFFMIGPTAQQTRCLAWLRKNLPSHGRVSVRDVTSMYTSINVIGPKAIELLSELTSTPLDKHNFPSMTCQQIDICQASNVLTMRLTHTGEDGWVLYIPSEYALHVYDALKRIGANYGIRDAGYYALRALRTEKLFAYWGSDLTPRVTPLECGRQARVKMDKGGFIGHSALLKQQREGIKRRLVQFQIERHDVNNDIWPWGREPIYRNGRFCGLITSTAYGFTLHKHVCMGFVHDYDDNGIPQTITNDFILKDGHFDIDIAGKRFPTKAGIYPPNLASTAMVIGDSNLH